MPLCIPILTSTLVQLQQPANNVDTMLLVLSHRLRCWLSSRSSEARCMWTKALSKYLGPVDRAWVTRALSLCCRQNTPPAWLCLSSIWTSTGGSRSRKGLASGWPEFNRSTMSVRIVPIFLPPRTWRHNASYWLDGTPSQLRSTPLSRQAPERGCTSPPVPAIIQTHCPPSQYPSPYTWWILVWHQ